MTMLKSFDLQGNKQSFADWISNLSPCETPFISMIGKEKIDQVQYSWQTDALSKPVNDGVQEGSVVVITKPSVTSVNTNYTQIFRKGVRVTDTTKQIGLWGRGSELGYQMEKAGMEIKRDIESALLNSTEPGRPGTPALHGIAAGVQTLIAGRGVADGDTGAIVHKVVTYAAGAHNPKFTQVQVFDLTYNLYLAGSKANKVMFHPMHMGVFSDWIGSNSITPHVHRMFDGMDTKYNAHVSTFRDPLGQVFELIPNRYMPKNQLFFFNESDWTQMVLREPAKTELGKTGSSEKFLIEMELGLRHRNPLASGILEFNAVAFNYVSDIKAVPGAIVADNVATSEVSVVVRDSAGAIKTGASPAFTVQTINDDGSVAAATVGAVTASDAEGKAKTTVKHSKGARIKVKAVEGGDSNFNPAKEAEIGVDTFVSRD